MQERCSSCNSEARRGKWSGSRDARSDGEAAAGGEAAGSRGSLTWALGEEPRGAEATDVAGSSMCVEKGWSRTQMKELDRECRGECAISGLYFWLLR